MGRELKEKVSREVCWIELRHCLVSLGKSLCARVCFVCIEHGETTWHFIFELIARCPVAASAARLLSEKPPLTSSTFLLQNKSATKSDYDQERFTGMIKKKKEKKNTKLRVLWSKTPKAVRLERGKREPCLHITFWLGSKQLRRLSQGICLNPAQEERKMLITENNLQEN